MKISPKVFGLIFKTNVILVILSLIVSVAVSYVASPNALQMRLFDMCETTWKIGLGVLFGLLGGKNT